MRLTAVLACLPAALCLSLSPAAMSAERIPPELAAKRAGVKSESTPAPLELVYTAIAPCRVFAKNIPADAPAHFQVTGNGNLTSQGGPAAGCGIPTYAKAVSITYSTMKPAITGSLTAYAKGASRPGVVAARFNKGLYETTAGQVDLNSLGQMSIYPSEKVSVLGDVTGYYAPQIWAYISSSGVILDTTGRLVSIAKTGTGSYTLTFDRNIDACALNVTPDYSSKFATGYTSSNVAYVYTYNGPDGAPIDYWFFARVSC